jgi:hypothetical protein
MNIRNIFKRNNTLTVEQIYDLLEQTYNKYGISRQDYKKIIINLDKICDLSFCPMEKLKLVKIENEEIEFEENDKIIKIVPNFSQKLYYYSGSIQKPKMGQEQKIGDMNITVLSYDKLNKENITDKDLIKMYIRLRNDGYLWNNPKVESLGRNKEDRLKLTTTNNLLYLNDKPAYEVVEELEKHEQNLKAFDDAYKQSKIKIDTRRK